MQALTKTETVSESLQHFKQNYKARFFIFALFSIDQQISTLTQKFSKIAKSACLKRNKNKNNSKLKNRTL